MSNNSVAIIKFCDWDKSLTDQDYSDDAYSKPEIAHMMSKELEIETIRNFRKALIDNEKTDQMDVSNFSYALESYAQFVPLGGKASQVLSLALLSLPGDLPNMTIEHPTRNEGVRGMVKQFTDSLSEQISTTHDAAVRRRDGLLELEFSVIGSSTSLDNLKNKLIEATDLETRRALLGNMLIYAARQSAETVAEPLIRRLEKIQCTIDEYSNLVRLDGMQDNHEQYSAVKKEEGHSEANKGGDSEVKKEQGTE